MDLLGSILDSMDKPPIKDKKECELLKKQKLELENINKKEKEKLAHFRKYVEERLGRLVNDTNRTYMEFQPLEKVYRTIVHDVAEIAGLLGISYGVEGVDRYIVVYKKESMPTEFEMLARRNGDPWNAETAKEYARKKDETEIKEKEKLVKSEHVEPSKNYQDKYTHLINQESALEARKTESNKSYGYVPSANKKDLRSIEQTMLDIQAKKKLKTVHNVEN